MASREEQALPERIGDYRILRRLGSGGMGVVYAAQRSDSSVTCALKVIRCALDDRHARRLQREADLLRRLRHPGIAAFHESGNAELITHTGHTRVPFLAMELVEGVPLTEYAARHDLDDAQRVELIARVCNAVDQAHRAGVIHRDLKPSNVLVAEVDRDPIGQPKIVDFGIARALEPLDAQATSTLGELTGTALYMSPEQASGGEKAIDLRTDIYSLGVLLFETLTDRLPYDLGTLAMAARVIQFAQPAKLGAIAPRLAGDLELVVAKTLEKESARRYASAADLASDLRAFVAGRPVTARPDNLPRRTRKWIGRHPLASALLGLGTVALTGVTVLWTRAAQARDLAIARATTAEASAERARLQEREVQRQRANVLRLADRKRLRELQQDARELWPARPRAGVPPRRLADRGRTARRTPRRSPASAGRDPRNPGR